MAIQSDGRSNQQMTGSTMSKFDEAIDETNKESLAVRNDIALPKYLYWSLAVLWLYSGVVPVLFAQVESLAMLAQLGISEPYQMVVFLLASAMDVGFGLMILSPYRRYAWLWLMQLLVVASYSLIVAVGLPENWTHPFAPLIKNLPIMALLLYVYHQHSMRADTVT